MLTDAQHPWQKSWSIQMQDMARRSDTSYWNQRAHDYDNFINTSEFDYGRQMARVLSREGLLGPQTSVLEIASGVGAATLPLACKANKLTAIEPARNMAELLLKNAQKDNLDNIEVIVQDFASFAAQTAKNNFDLVFLCHAAWQFPDLAWLIAQMNRLSCSYCCLADTMGLGNSEHLAMHRQLGLNTPELDRTLYLYNALYELGILANITYIPHLMRRSVASASSMWKNLICKYRPLSASDEDIINSYILARTKNGIYQTPGTMSLIWWRSK